MAVLSKIERVPAFPSTVSKSAAAPALRIWGGSFEGQTHILGGQDIIFKKVLLFAHAVVTGLSPPPQKIRPPLRGGGRYS